MASRLPFTFGIALAPRGAVRRWDVVEALLGLTLASVRAQTDPDFRVLVLGHDQPGRLCSDDPRIRFIAADWPAAAQDAPNSDAGRKKHLLRRHALEAGDGLFMFLDADDWVDRRLVETARAHVTGEAAGGLITRGLAVDFRNFRAAPIPDPALFPGGFHELCGSSTVARLCPGADDAVLRDPCRALGSHHRWPETAARLGLEVARLPVTGAYLVNTSENHSETHGPFAEWRRRFSEDTRRRGAALDDHLLGPFGLDLKRVRRAAA